MPCLCGFCPQHSAFSSLPAETYLRQVTRMEVWIQLPLASAVASLSLICVSPHVSLAPWVGTQVWSQVGKETLSWPGCRESLTFFSHVLCRCHFICCLSWQPVPPPGDPLDHTRQRKLEVFSPKEMCKCHLPTVSVISFLLPKDSAPHSMFLFHRILQPDTSPHCWSIAPGMLGGLLFFPSFGFPGHPGMCQQSRTPELTELGIFQASPTPECSYRKA